MIDFILATSALLFAGLWLRERRARKVERKSMLSAYDRIVRKATIDLATLNQMLRSA